MPVVRPLVELHRTRQVAQCSGLDLEGERLRAHLLGADRVAVPNGLRGMLVELQQGACFSCGGRLCSTMEVDHFVPWSRWPDNAIENLSAADRRCDNDERDRLAAMGHVERRSSSLETSSAAVAVVAADAGWESAPERTAAPARAGHRLVPARSDLTCVPCALNARAPAGRAVYRAPAGGTPVPPTDRAPRPQGGTMLKRALATLGAVGLLAALAAVPSASAATKTDTSVLRQAVTVDGVRQHQAVFQAIADANGGIREASSPGYFASADYVAGEMAAAGYDVTVQPFDFPYFAENSPAVLEQVAPNPTTYVLDDDFATMSYSGSGDVTAPTQAVDLLLPPAPDANTSTSGCEAADFAGFTPGNVAVIQRGTCAFALKALNAQAAGASAVVIFNEGQPGRDGTVFGTLGQPGITVPVVGTSLAAGVELAQVGVTARVRVDAVSETRTTVNVIADTAGGRDDRVVVVGAHLDSVAEGPGIQDNGSGSAAILEIALQMAELGIQPVNKVRFAWWGAEEAGPARLPALRGQPVGPRHQGHRRST